MELSNSLVSTQPIPDRIKRPSQNQNAAQERLAERPSDSRIEPSRRLAPPEELERRSNELQESRVQRLDGIDSAPLRAQQALSTYQQTVDAGRAYEDGELVGLDLFV